MPNRFGFESAGAALGHTNMSVTVIYAERNQGLADVGVREVLRTLRGHGGLGSIVN